MQLPQKLPARARLATLEEFQKRKVKTWLSLEQYDYQQLQHDVLKRRINDDFFDALQRYDIGELTEAGPAGCDSDKCLLPLSSPSN